MLLISFTAACGGILTAPEGNITSPSYPDNYPKNKRCIWKITGPKGQRISLKFLAFQLEGSGYGVRLVTESEALLQMCDLLSMICWVWCFVLQSAVLKQPRWEIFSSQYRDRPNNDNNVSWLALAYLSRQLLFPFIWFSYTHFKVE